MTDARSDISIGEAGDISIGDLQTCFRAILMTTICAILDGLSLMLANETGSELRKPLGFAMLTDRSF